MNARLGLSYAGDPRFLIGAESSNKVSDIVDANLEGFQLLYRPLLRSAHATRTIPFIATKTHPSLLEETQSM